MNVSLTASLERAVHAIGLHVERELRHRGLTQAEAHVLARLHAVREAAIRDLQRGFGHRPSTLTGVLDRLERRGYVERRSHTEDRRSTLVVLTADGEAAAVEAAHVVGTVERGVEEAVGQSDLEAVQRVVAAVERAAR